MSDTQIAPKVKKRTAKACDICSKRKIKCNGLDPCSQCLEYDRECTYLAPTKRRGPSLNTPSGSTDKLVVDASHNSNPVKSNWNHQLLLNQKLPNQFGQSIPWIDFYYQFVFPRIPIIPREFLTNHFFEISPFLLHSMISCCFVCGTAVDQDLILHHQQSLMLLEESLLEADLFTIAGLAHLSHYCLQTGLTAKCLAYFALATRQAHILRLERDSVPNCNMLSKLNVPLNVNELIIGCSIHLYQYDYYLSVAADVPYLMQNDIPEYLNAVYTENSLNLYYIGRF